MKINMGYSRLERVTVTLDRHDLERFARDEWLRRRRRTGIPKHDPPLLKVEVDLDEDAETVTVRFVGETKDQPAAPAAEGEIND